MTQHLLRDGRTLTLYRPRAGEAAEILEYLRTVGAETSYLLIDANGVSLSLEQEAELLERYYGQQRSALYVGRIDGEIALISNIDVKSNPRTRHTAMIGVSVLKKYWHIGAGSAAMETVIRHARAVDVEIIGLEVFANNPRAIALYERFGFEYVGRHRNHIKIDGEYYDELCMDLHLREIGGKAASLPSQSASTERHP